MRSAHYAKHKPDPPEPKDRACPECGKRVYYGIYCDNTCADAGYRKWKKERDDAARPITHPDR